MNTERRSKLRSGHLEEENFSSLLAVLMPFLLQGAQQQEGLPVPPEIMLDDLGQKYTIAPDLGKGVVNIRIDSPSRSGDKKSETFQLPLCNQVRPTMRLLLSNNDEIYVYDYQLGNGLIEGVKPIQSVEIVLPAETIVNDVQSPKGWQNGIVPSAISTVPYSLDGAVKGLFFGWYVAFSTTEPLTPGKMLSGFSVKSRWRPGLVYSYARTISPTGKTTPQFPEKIGRAVAKYYAPEYSARTLITVGPFYAPEMSKEEIAKSYIRRFTGIRNLVNTAEDRNFIVEIERAIRNQVEIGIQSSRHGILCNTLRQVKRDTHFKEAASGALVSIFCRES